jgi:hypothetical protein
VLLTLANLCEHTHGAVIGIGPAATPTGCGVLGKRVMLRLTPLNIEPCQAMQFSIN